MKCHNDKINLWDNLSFPDDLDWLDIPAGKDSCRRFRMAFQQSLLMQDKLARLANQASASILPLYADFAADCRFR